MECWEIQDSHCNLLRNSIDRYGKVRYILGQKDYLTYATYKKNDLEPYVPKYEYNSKIRSLWPIPLFL